MENNERKVLIWMMVTGVIAICFVVYILFGIFVK